MAIIAAMFISTCFFGLAAIGVDTARWSMEGELIQKAADAAALAGVTYLPTDFPSAKTTALDVASKNGYPVGTNVTVTVAVGSQPSQLVVKISSRVDNTFGAAIGHATAWITRSGTADYTAPAPMGSPCNTFGNEPPSQPNAALPAGSALPATPFPNCAWTSTNQPQFWGALNGPDTPKVQGDRFMSRRCSGGEFGCSAATATGNSEYDETGYFWVVHVEPLAVGKAIDVQLYDPAYVAVDATNDSAACSLTGLVNNLNGYTTTDGASRYSQSKYCTGDFQQGGVTGAGPTTTFTMREQTDTGDPMKAAVISGCTKQYQPYVNSSANLATALKAKSGSTNLATYNPQLAEVFHQWTSLCTFTPTRRGDWFIQVRTNASTNLGTAVTNKNPQGTTLPSLIYTGNPQAGLPAGTLTSGAGLNAFAIRAVPQPTTDDATRKQIAVSGYSKMPIYQNSTASTATFNLIRALPNTKGSYVAFDFFDAADATGSGSVTVLPPGDATGSIQGGSGIAGCRGSINTGSYSNLAGCKASVSSSQDNGQLHHILVPIPNDYSCDVSTLGGCWFKVAINFGSSDVTDFTTWNANITGDPVRLIK